MSERTRRRPRNVARHCLAAAIWTKKNRAEARFSDRPRSASAGAPAALGHPQGQAAHAQQSDHRGHRNRLSVYRGVADAEQREVAGAATTRLARHIDVLDDGFRAVRGRRRRKRERRRAFHSFRVDERLCPTSTPASHATSPGRGRWRWRRHSRRRRWHFNGDRARHRHTAASHRRRRRQDRGRRDYRRRIWRGRRRGFRPNRRGAVDRLLPASGSERISGGRRQAGHRGAHRDCQTDRPTSAQFFHACFPVSAVPPKEAITVPGS